MNIPSNITGLNEQEVIASRKQFGSNTTHQKERSGWLTVLLDMLKEPMLLLLIATTIIYFVLGETGEAYFMLSAITIVSGISFYQDGCSRKALEGLEALNQPMASVVRNGAVQEIAMEELVVKDMMLVEEGNSIPADGTIVYSTDFSVNESILTGESFTVYKSANNDDNTIFQGTVVVTGMAICKVTSIGITTRLGKLGESLKKIKQEDTPLQIQIRKFVNKMAIAGVIVFVLVWLTNYVMSGYLLDSLLKGLTLAMSILPEEIPVAFTTFMALGAWRLMQKGIIVKRVITIETLGSATEICVDKTGTITENKMELKAIYVFKTNEVLESGNWQTTDTVTLITNAMWASEPIPFDPMEKALHEVYASLVHVGERVNFKLVHEYPLEGRPPMMTHVHENSSGERIIAAKGAPEAILAVSILSDNERNSIIKQMQGMAQKGYRVLGVATTTVNGNNYPVTQQELKFNFSGLVAFYDPPKANINEVFKQFYDAGIRVKIITGDNTATTLAIAKQAGFKNGAAAIEGDELLKIDEATLTEKLRTTNIFTRMFPEAKLRIINALKNDNQVVAMTGDGVNDGPALKAAHIGIAMGKKGSEVAKHAAALVLANDDLSKMIDAIALGRKIYTNLKKAIQYIISIHIPIILTVSLPLFLGWLYPNIFTPVHVIFLEIIMGPTCSIVYENEPMEKNTMLQPPRPFTTTFLSLREMLITIVQGLMITAGVLTIYQYCVQDGYDENTTRAMVFTTLLFANTFLTLVNRSLYYSFIITLRYRNNLLLIVILVTLLMLGVILYLHPVSIFFGVVPLNEMQLLICVIAATISVFWIELWKWIKRSKQKTQ
ncbi:HAD-IC family P-type ATPase [soil metagenome]